MSRGRPTADDLAFSRQLVILSVDEPPPGQTLAPIGARARIVEGLARRNTGPESDDAPDVLYGPGFRIELAPGQDPVNQMLVTITEEEIGWLVLERIVREFRWRLLDANTGRELPAPADGAARDRR